MVADVQQTIVSIHVPLAEHDMLSQSLNHVLLGFNSRAPRGARLILFIDMRILQKFQFTCPSRSTTTKRIRTLMS